MYHYTWASEPEWFLVLRFGENSGVGVTPEINKTKLLGLPRVLMVQNIKNKDHK